MHYITSIVLPEQKQSHRLIPSYVFTNVLTYHFSFFFFLLLLSVGPSLPAHLLSQLPLILLSSREFDHHMPTLWTTVHSAGKRGKIEINAKSFLSHLNSLKNKTLFLANNCIREEPLIPRCQVTTAPLANCLGDNVFFIQM